ncbi:MAG: virion core protein, T7 gp14 family [Bordetella sp.]|uniref:virion core protein, T7 gp14 family n=1 Tax=Bordetella sp. TaxID=28081 RepID=UPI003F7CCE7D
MSGSVSATTVAYGSLAATAIGAGVSAYSAISQGNAQAAAADYNAKIAQNNTAIAQMNANSSIQQGNQQLQAAQEQAAQRQGAIRAVMGSGGIDLNSGSSLRDQEGVAEVDQLNQATIVNNAARSAWNYKNQGADYSATANLDTAQAQQAEMGGMLSGFGSAIAGAGQFGSNWTKDKLTVKGF